MYMYSVTFIAYTFLNNQHVIHSFIFSNHFVMVRGMGSGATLGTRMERQRITEGHLSGNLPLAHFHKGNSL